jgi:hypothetical protein
VQSWNFAGVRTVNSLYEREFLLARAVEPSSMGKHFARPGVRTMMMRFTKNILCMAAIALGLAMNAGAVLAAGHGGSGGGGHGGHAGASGGHGGGWHGNGSGRGGFRGRGFFGAGAGLWFIGGPDYGYGVGPYYAYDTDPWWFSDPENDGTHLEREGPPAGAAGDAPSWFYCDNPKGYYPYIQTCVSGWQRVSPFAPPPPRSGSY